MRQLAWLAATPKGGKRSRIESITLAAEAYGEAPEYDLPEVGEIRYLIDLLSEIGEAQSSNGMLRPNNWTDIRNWSYLTGIELDHWEAVALISLSRDYVNQYSKSSEANCAPPNKEELPQKEAVASKLKAFFAMLKGG